MICVAGMEGALPSVVAGLVGVPVIAVPTSIGYGASFGGVAALLSMLNSCASNVTVVNIDNGFGAAYVASAINRLVKHFIAAPPLRQRQAAPLPPETPCANPITARRVPPERSPEFRSQDAATSLPVPRQSACRSRSRPHGDQSRR